MDLSGICLKMTARAHRRTLLSIDCYSLREEAWRVLWASTRYVEVSRPAAVVGLRSA